MNFKSIGLLVLFIFSSVVLSCSEDQCPESIPYFYVSGISSLVLDNRSRQPISTSNPMVWGDISYQIWLETKGITQGNYSPNGSLLAQECHVIGYAGSENGILELDIINNANYSSEIPMGDSATSLFEVEVSDKILSVEEFVSIYRQNYNFTDFRLRLLESPDEGGELQSFIIKLKFVDGTFFETTTSSVRILK